MTAFKYTEAELWIRASQSYVFLRDGNLKMKLYFCGHGKMEIVPCPVTLKEASETRMNLVKQYYEELRKQYGYMPKENRLDESCPTGSSS